MLKEYRNRVLLIALLSTLPLLLIWLGCDENKKPKEDKTVTGTNDLVTLKSKQRYSIGDTVMLSLVKKEGIEVDSAEVYLETSLDTTYNSVGEELAWLPDVGIGEYKVKVRFFFKDGKTLSMNRAFMFLADKEPRKYTYKIQNEYPHYVGSYTQGLQYCDGYLLESAGYYGESALRKVDIKSGEILKEEKLSSEFFAEGLTIVGDEIYQLTWETNRAFVYDRTTFELKRELKYPKNMEGWGLTYDGENLIMSDGSHYLYFLDPETFTIRKTVGIYDHQGPQRLLNELEYIDGKVFANVYQTDNIVIIDPKTGQVEGTIDMSGLLKAYEVSDETDVLNGIAFDAETGRYFVTGKYWPKLFQIELQ